MTDSAERTISKLVELYYDKVQQVESLERSIVKQRDFTYHVQHYLQLCDAKGRYKHLWRSHD